MIGGWSLDRLAVEKVFATGRVDVALSATPEQAGELNRTRLELGGFLLVQTAL